LTSCLGISVLSFFTPAMRASTSLRELLETCSPRTPGRVDDEGRRNLRRHPRDGVRDLNRIAGYPSLRYRALGPAREPSSKLPGRVLVSMIAPSFVSHRPADSTTLAIAAFAATRLS